MLPGLTGWTVTCRRRLGNPCCSSAVVLAGWGCTEGFGAVVAGVVGDAAATVELGFAVVAAPQGERPASGWRMAYRPESVAAWATRLKLTDGVSRRRAGLGLELVAPGVWSRWFMRALRPEVARCLPAVGLSSKRCSPALPSAPGFISVAAQARGLGRRDHASLYLPPSFQDLTRTWRCH